MEKLKMHSPDVIDENISRLEELFPNCITESVDKNGNLKRSVDFDLLKQELSSSIVEGPQERYTLNWPGKREALLTANTPIAKTLRPCREESVDFDDTENLFIEGDNLDALKLLQENYLGKVKMIYIDPPYNTGKDFVYNDKFKAEKEKYDLQGSERDNEGNKLFAEEKYKQNLISNGLFHSDWLSMMYPRLKLARNLLRDDGVIFISMDDHEVHNLRKICDEIFGEDNFIAYFIHKNNSNKNQAKLISISTEYIICFSKNKKEVLENSENWKIPKKGASDIVKIYKKLKKRGLSINEIDVEIKDLYSRPKYTHLSRWNKVDNKGVFKDENLSREGGPKDYTIINPETKRKCTIPPRGWGKSYEELLELQRKDLIWYGDEKTAPGWKYYLTENTRSIISDFLYFDNSIDTKWIKKNLGGLVFDFPKPLSMLKTLIKIQSNNCDIVLDFFSGSATTAHAVMQLNAEDGGSRKFIMVQLPEVCNGKSEAFRAGYPTIAEISKERIRRAGKKIIEDNADKEGIENLDTGFRVLKVDSSNMKDVYYTPDQFDQGLLELMADNVKEDRTDEDLLFQVILDWGLDLSLPIEKEKISGRDVFFVNENDIVACFADHGEIDGDFVRELAKRQPLRVVFRDAGFSDDSIKINVEQIFKLISPQTEIKTI